MALVLNSDYISPAELTGYVREALKDRPINDLKLIDDLLPDTLIDDVDFRANISQLGLRRAAKFRTWDTEAPQSARKGVARISGELPRSRRSVDSVSTTGSVCARRTVRSPTSSSTMASSSRKRSRPG